METGLRSIGVDIGGTKVAVGLLADGRLLERSEAPTPAADLDELLQLVERLVQPFIRQAEAVGVCTPGYHDPRTGRIAFASNLPALVGVELATALSHSLGRAVTVGNDADAATLAEYRLGAARGWDSVFYLTVSTGIGGGYMGPAGLLRGHSGGAAEVGHLCVVPEGRTCGCSARGCLEAHGSGTAIAAQASALKRRELSTRQVFAAWQAGDAECTRVIHDAAAAVARGLAAVCQLLDPQGLLLGGGVAAGNPEFRELVAAELAGMLHNRPVPSLEPAALGVDAGVMGAALLPLEAA